MFLIGVFDIFIHLQKKNKLINPKQLYEKNYS